MILLLGADGYIGQAFARHLASRGEKFVPLSPAAFDYTRFELLFDYVRKMRPAFVINAGSFASASQAEHARTDIFRINTVLPETVARVCVVTNTPWGHVSSANIYAGAKSFVAGKLRVTQKLNRSESRRSPDPLGLFGFTELDEPNRSFQSPPCDFYAGTAALAEKALREYTRGYIWRMRLPFDDREDPANWLSQLQSSTAVPEGLNSASHLTECVGACLDLWEGQAPFGIYNVVNPGTATTTEVLKMIQGILRPGPRVDRLLENLSDGDSKTLSPDCILDGAKLLRAGVKLRDLTNALEEALHSWQSANQIFLEVNPVTETSAEILDWSRIQNQNRLVRAELGH